MDNSSNTVSNTVEQRFEQLKTTMTGIQWNNPEYLKTVVARLETEDLELAFRLMQRVKNIKATPESIKELNRIKLALQSAQPKALAKVSSEDIAPAQSRSNLHTHLQNTIEFFQQPRWAFVRSPFIMFVLLPFVVFAFYQIVIASDRYESRAQIIVKQPDSASTLDPAMAFISGLGGNGGDDDSELVKAFIYSNNMLSFLEDKLALKAHFSQHGDMFSRLPTDASTEDLLKFYEKYVTVELDDASGVLVIRAQAFTPEFAEQIAESIISHAEWYINNVSNDLAKSQLEFVKKEHEVTEMRLQNAKMNLLDFQRKNNLLDPEAEGMALQQITYALESQISSKEAELSGLLSQMSENAPLVVRAKTELESLRQQLVSERERLTKDVGSDGQESGVGELLAKFSNYKIELEFALQAYAASQVSLEKSRIEAYRQIKYLVVVETPLLPEDAKYPKVLYNLLLFFVVLMMCFGIGKIIVATVDELR